MPRNKEFDYNIKLEIARNLFWEKGYHATSMHDLVSTLGLNRSSIYDTYGNKEELFLKCLVDYSKLKENQYKKASSVGKKAIDNLEFIIRDVVNQTLKDNKACFIVNTIFEVASTNNQIKALLNKNGVILQTILEEKIHQAQLDGDIKSSKNPIIIARFILSTFSTFWSHYILSQNEKEVQEMVDFLIEQIKK